MKDISSFIRSYLTTMAALRSSLGDQRQRLESSFLLLLPTFPFNEVDQHVCVRYLRIILVFRINAHRLD